MARRVAFQGERFAIVFAAESGGGCPAGEFFDALDVSDKAKLMALFRIAGDHGSFVNEQKFGDLGNGLYEFKSFQIRMPFAYSKNERGVIVVTHGFFKKKDKTPRLKLIAPGESTKRTSPSAG